MYDVLIVEDEFLQKEAMKSMISSRVENVQVVGTAEDGQEALDKFKELNPDIVLMDIHIPKINGLETSKRMKNINPKVSIIILTAYSEFEYAQKAIKINVDDYILKPARPDKVVEAINASIEKIEKDSLILGDVTYEESTFKTNYLTGDYASAKDDLYEILRFESLEFKDIHDVKEYILVTVEETARNYGIDRSDEEFKNLYNKLQISNDTDEFLKSLMYLSQYIYGKLLEVKISTAKDELDLSLQYIELNLHEKIGLNDVAGYVHISPTYYSRLFKENIGLNFIEYLTNRRIKTAKLLLEHTKLSIYEIAEKVGFNESNYFSRVFKESTGISPSEYRSNEREK